MLNPRIAGRYAKSLIDLAVEKDQLEAVYQDMVYLQNLNQASPEFVRILKSPVIKGDKKEKILEALTKDKMGNISQSFNRLLVKKGREAYIPEIVSAFIQQYKDYKGIHIVSLTTAVPLTEESRSAIVNRINESAQLKEVELRTKVDPDIIGGFIIEVDGRLMDASILYDLNTIKKQFESNDFIYKIR
ncbi:MAG TPA: ATP synthase F1 subunit delta [Puia sp.]|jgi:F-type H+-transporting ATPase subunit delta